MLELKIRFESSWTNSLFHEGEDGNRDKPLFTSGGELSKSVKGLKPVELDMAQLAASKSRVGFLQTLQSKNPGMLYRVPVSFDRAVQGVLARLMGEIRRLKDVEDDHLALRVFKVGHYEIDIEHEHSQLIKLATYTVNDVQTGGAGLIVKDALYSAGPESQYLFAMLGNSLAAMESSLATGASVSVANWVPTSPAALIDRLNFLDEEQADAISAAKKSLGDAYTTPYPHLFEHLSNLFAGDASATLAAQTEREAEKLAQRTVKNPPAGNEQVVGEAPVVSIVSGGLDGWSIAGATIVSQVIALSDSERARYVEAGLLTKNGGFAGLAMSGGVGNVTPKDLYKFASGQKAQSSSMPYSVEIPVVGNSGKKSFVPSGVLKKTGTLTFKIDDDQILEDELRLAIDNASVGIFHFGKKGIAYVQSLR